MFPHATRNQISSNGICFQRTLYSYLSIHIFLSKLFTVFISKEKAQLLPMAQSVPFRVTYRNHHSPHGTRQQAMESNSTEKKKHLGQKMKEQHSMMSCVLQQRNRRINIQILVFKKGHTLSNVQQEKINQRHGWPVSQSLYAQIRTKLLYSG